jgi:hypothetical protein
MWKLTENDMKIMLEDVYSRRNLFDPANPKEMLRNVYLHFSKGIKVVYDRTAPIGKGSKSVHINGVALDPKKMYTFGTDEWVLGGKEFIYKEFLNQHATRSGSVTFKRP